MTHFTALFCIMILNLLYVIEGAVYSTNIIWTTSTATYYRPSWSGNVTINYTEWVGDIPGQIWKIEGIILPISTTGRPSAPEPYNGYPTGSAYGLDKGHLMRLSSGGPDISLNIVPQSSQWQQSGGWAAMETTVYNFALYKYGWKPVSHASEIQHVAKPNSCNVIFIVEPVIYNSSNGQPLLYNGSVRCGVELYKFKISPPPGNDTAVWYPYAPPTSSSNNDKDNGIKGWQIALIVAGIIVLICIMVIVYYKWRNDTIQKRRVSFERDDDSKCINEQDSNSVNQAKTALLIKQ